MPILWMYQLLPRCETIYYLLYFISQHRFPPRIIIDFSRGQVPIPQSHRTAFKCQTKTFFTKKQSCFGLFSLANIHNCSQQFDYFWGFVVKNSFSPFFHVEYLTAGMQKSEL